MGIVTLLLVAVFSSGAHAAVTLQDAYQSALEKTEAVPLQQALAASAEEKISQGYARILPSLSLIANFTRQQPTSTGNNAFTNPNQYSARLNLTQPLFRGFGEWAELRSREGNATAQRLTVDSTRVTLYGTVADAFLNVLAAERDRENVRLLAELTDKRMEELKGRVKIGRSRRGELLSAEAQSALLLAQLTGSDQAIAQTREIFRNVTGLEARTPLADNVTEPPTTLPPLESYLASINERPDIVAARTRVEAAREQIAVARSGHFPTLDASANLYLLRTGILQDSHYDFGFVFTLPLFAGGGVSSAVRDASEITKQSELGLAKLQRDADRDVRSQYVAVVSLLAQHQALDRAGKLAERNYEEQTRDYRYGLVTNLEVLQALNSFQETKRTQDRTRFQWLAAWAKLRAATAKSAAQL